MHYQQLAVSFMDKYDVAFIISQSGMNKTILKITEKAIKNNIKVIGICNYIKTPFAKTVTIPIRPFNDLKENLLRKFLFKIPILCILETIYQMIQQQLGKS